MGKRRLLGVNGRRLVIWHSGRTWYLGTYHGQGALPLPLWLALLVFRLVEHDGGQRTYKRW